MPTAFPATVLPPLASVPRKLPAMTLFEEKTRIAIWGERLMIRPRTVLFPALRVRTPLVLAPAPLISTLGAFAAHPGCVSPAMVTRRVMTGRSEPRTIVKDGPGRAKLMVSAGTLEFASWIAARRVQKPPASAQVLSPMFASGVSPVLLTVKVAAWAGATRAADSRARSPSPRGSGPGRTRLDGLVGAKKCRSTGASFTAPHFASVGPSVTD